MIDTFVELLATDTAWRSKILKIIQYVARTLIHAHSTKRPSFVLQLLLGSALPLSRLKVLAQSISLSRRMLYFGETLVYARDALIEIGGLRPNLALASRPSALAALTSLLAGIGEDLALASKIGLISSSSLPSFFSRFVEVTWALQCCWYMYFAAASLISAQRTCVQTERDSAAALLSTKPSTRAAARSAVVAAQRARYLAMLNAIKCAADCAQSLPYAAGWSAFPESLEIQVRCLHRIRCGCFCTVLVVGYHISGVFVSSHCLPAGWPLEWALQCIPGMVRC